MLRTWTLLCVLCGFCVWGAALPGCNSNDSIGVLPGGGDGGEDGSALMSFGDGMGQADAAGSGSYCSGSGPPVLLTPDGGTAGEACTGRLAQVAFRYGLCTCQALNAGAQVTVDSYDSQMVMTPGSLGGSVGLNGNMATSSGVSIGGSLYIGDPGGMNFTSVSIGQELHCAGSAVGSGSLSVGANAFVNGDANVGGALTVGGILTLPAGRVLSGNPVPTKVVRAPVTVAPPCDCSAGSLVNVAGYIAEYQQQNDDQAIFLSPDRLKNFAGDTTLPLPCGRYYLSQINGTGALTLQINGRVALFIGGDVELQEALTITIGTGAELDLFIGGALNASAALNLGSPQTASQLRIYMASSSDISLSANVTLAGNLYAPLAQLNEGSNLTVYGALFVRRVSISGALTIHQDTAIFRAGSGCPAPVPGCTSCRDCGNQACASGVCGGCTDSSQCCAPLECISGQCAYYVG